MFRGFRWQLAALLLAAGLFVVSLLLPIVNGPKASWEEAMWGIIPGGCCSVTSLAILVGGVLWWAFTPKGNGKKNL